MASACIAFNELLLLGVVDPGDHIHGALLEIQSLVQLAIDGEGRPEIVERLEVVGVVGRSRDSHVGDAPPGRLLGELELAEIAQAHAASNAGTGDGIAALTPGELHRCRQSLHQRRAP